MAISSGVRTLSSLWVRKLTAIDRCTGVADAQLRVRYAMNLDAWTCKRWFGPLPLMVVFACYID